MRTENILLIGAGGHAQACIDVIEAGGRFQIHGLIGSATEVGKYRLGYPIVGTDENLHELRKSCANALVCIGQIKTPAMRVRLFHQLRETGYTLPAIISPTAWVSPHANIGAGSIVMHGAIVNAGAEIGENCIINTRALIEHDVTVEDHCHISTGALVNGNALIGSGSFLGSGSTIKEGVHVGQSCIVGIGAVVRSDLARDKVFKKNCHVNSK